MGTQTLLLNGSQLAWVHTCRWTATGWHLPGVMGEMTHFVYGRGEAKMTFRHPDYAGDEETPYRCPLNEDDLLDWLSGGEYGDEQQGPERPTDSRQ